MKLFLQIVLLLLVIDWCVPAQATITCVQGSTSPCAATHAIATSTASSATISQTVTAPTAGNALTLITGQGTMGRTVSSIGGTAGCDSPGWQLIDHADNTQGPVYVYACASITGGGTTVTATWSGNCISNFCFLQVSEFHTDTGLSWVLPGASGHCNAAAATATSPWCSLTLPGANNVIAGGIVSAGTASGCTGTPSPLCTFTTSHYGQGFQITVSSYGPPAWTNTASAAYATAVVAIAEPTAGVNPSGFDKRRRYEQVDE